jgi:hypothetical protein
MLFSSRVVAGGLSESPVMIRASLGSSTLYSKLVVTETF